MIFTSKPRITQYFAANPQYYKQFNLFGHEGIDLVPRGTEWTIYSWIHGIVKRVYFSEVYGVTCIIYEPKNKLSWRIAHMESCQVTEGVFIEYDSIIGIMGDTPSGRDGITGKMKAHVHINCVPMLEWGHRDFQHNGFKGRVDPLGVLRERGEL